MPTVQVDSRPFPSPCSTHFLLVQYYKGAALLWYLEQVIVGSEAEMDRFLQAYIGQFSRQPLNTDDFIRFFDSFFPHAPVMDWHSWLYKPGMPPVTLDFSTLLETECRHLGRSSDSHPWRSDQTIESEADGVFLQSSSQSVVAAQQGDRRRDRSSVSNVELFQLRDSLPLVSIVHSSEVRKALGRDLSVLDVDRTNEVRQAFVHRIQSLVAGNDAPPANLLRTNRNSS